MKLPNFRDFFSDELTQDQSALHAWESFGKLDIDQAYFKFIVDPVTSHWDFASMGYCAFKFYFAVIDRYLRVYRCGVGPGDPNESAAMNIAATLGCQLLRHEAKSDIAMREQLRDLCDYVRAHLGYLAADAQDQDSIDSYWQILSAQLAA
jgi:hypothetical protein